MTTKQILLASRPKGTPTIANFKFQNIELPEVHDGELLLQGLYYSVDPYMRGRMNDAKSYSPPFQLDQPIEGITVAKVIETKSAGFKTGDTVVGFLPWQEQFISTGKGLQKIDASIAPLTYYLGILGMTGLTAYFGLMDIGKPKANETVVVSAAAGAVGIVVGQMAKLQGCHVVGIAGSDDKIKMLKDLGFDDAINYKTTTDIKKAVKDLCPNGVDVYFDNVGGEISDAVMARINVKARIILCGQISMYNSTEIPMGPRIQPVLLTRSALMQGFIIGNYQSRFPEGMQQLTKWVAEKKLTFKETIVHGFDQLPSAFISLFDGKNIGKMIVAA